MPHCRTWPSGLCPGGAKTIVDRVQAELRRVHFELPEGFEKVSFWPLGLRGRGSWPFGGRIDRMLVISPFVAGSCLKRLTAVGEGHVLVSRSESLDALERTCLEPFHRVWVLSEGADPEPLDDLETIDENAHVDSERDSDDVAPLAGLHAKAYVADAGWNARVWMGSANASHAAFDGNVEFLVELEGKKSRCGVDAVLGQTKDSIGLADLLREYVPPDEPIGGDPIQEQLEERVNSARRQLAQAGLVARVSRAKVAGEYRVSLRLSGDRALDLPPEIGIRCWPITLQEATAADLVTNARGVVAIFGPLSFEALTSFFAFDLRLSESSRTASARFVLNLPLEGAPKDRRERILLSLLQNREQVLRYLLLLLAEGGFDPHAALLARRAVVGGVSGGTSGARLPLFEALVRALHRNPEKLDQVARLVDDLRKTPGGQELLPEGFEAVWQPIWSVRRGLKA